MEDSSASTYLWLLSELPQALSSLCTPNVISKVIPTVISRYQGPLGRYSPSGRQGGEVDHQVTPAVVLHQHRHRDHTQSAEYTDGRAHSHLHYLLHMMKNGDNGDMRRISGNETRKYHVVSIRQH